MDTLEELRTLQRDLLDLGDGVAVGLLQRAESCFLAWRMDEDERYLDQALSRVQETLAHPEPVGPARYFASCALAVA